MRHPEDAEATLVENFFCVATYCPGRYYGQEIVWCHIKGQPYRLNLKFRYDRKKRSIVLDYWEENGQVLWTFCRSKEERLQARTILYELRRCVDKIQTAGNDDFPK